MQTLRHIILAQARRYRGSAREFRESQRDMPEEMILDQQ